MIGKLAVLEQPQPEPLDAFDGERKFVTVMFVDIAQSGRFVAGCDPEDADDALLTLLQIMVEGVERFGGMVNQVLGDGVMAIFGAPRAQEDHGMRACLAAAAIRNRVRALNAEGSGAPDASSIRIGLSSGEVVVKEPNGDYGLKYRVVGEAVYLAQRLESAAPVNGVLISLDTLRLVSQKVAVRPQGVVRIRPDAEAVQAYLLEEIDLGQRPPGPAQRASEPLFIGRAKDLDRLETLWREVSAGEGRTLAMTGEAGIGKSRLLSEFLGLIPAMKGSAICCEILPAGMARVLEPSARILRHLLQLGSGTPPAESIAQALSELDVAGRNALSAVQQVFDLAVDDPAWSQLEPAERLQNIVETVADVVDAACRGAPMILAFEDFQWADSETRLLTQELAQRVPNSRLFLIVTSRESGGSAWAGWPAAQELELTPFSRSQTSDLLETWLGNDPALEELKHLLAVKTQGNPFFLGECVRALEDSGALTRVPGGYDLAVPVSELEIPATVNGVLAARIDALPAVDRTLLVSASVIGARVDVGLLRELYPMDREELFACLGRLQQSGFLERTRIVPNLEFSFRHALIHDVAYKTILKAKRQGLHARVLSAIEKRSEQQLHGKIDLLAHHAFLAEDWSKAFAYCRRAGRRAQGRSANREAARLFSSALTSLDRLPDSRRYRSREIDTRLEYVQTLFTLGKQDLAHRQLVEAQRLAEALDDRRRLTKVVSAFMVCHWVRADLKGAIAKGELALDLARRLGDAKSQIEIGTRLGSVYLDRGDYQSACGLLETTIGKISKGESFDRFGLLVIASVGSRTSLARALGELGHFAEAIRVGDEGIMIAEEAGHVFSQIYAYLFVGNALLRKGDFERSLPPLVRSFELCNSTRAKLLFPLSAATLGYAQVRLGALRDGLRLLRKAAAAAEHQALKFQLSQELTWLGEALLLSGQEEQARLHADNALETARRHGEIGDEAWALWLLGEIASRRSKLSAQQAESFYLRAQKIARRQLMAPLLAHTHYGLARVYQRSDRERAAVENLNLAISKYRSLEMDYWLNLAECTRTKAGLPIDLVD
ncbi:MAG: AAA family ATPase [Kiloniellales bacterium]|nr:AAA family ATPase [Kiloniellales bacterium]